MHSLGALGLRAWVGARGVDAPLAALPLVSPAATGLVVLWGAGRPTVAQWRAAPRKASLWPADARPRAVGKRSAQW